MSTILDALRKVEEEKRTQVQDVRTRLLSTSPRFDFRIPRRSRLPWIVGGGLMFAGIAFGAGLMLWGFSDTVSVKKEEQSASLGRQDQKQARPEPQVQSPLAQATQLKPTTSSPEIQSPIVASVPLPNTAETAPANAPWTSGMAPEAATKVTGQQRPETPPPASPVVQRSPFVNSSPDDRIVASPPVPPPSAPPRVATPPKPIVRRPPAPVNTSQSPPAAISGNATSEQETRPRSSSSPTSAGQETLSAPPGASLSFLQWSADPEKRVASIKVGTAPATIAHEGDSIEGMTVIKIRPDAVELRSGDSHYVLKAQ